VDPPVGAEDLPDGADPRVADAVRRLQGLPGRPTEEHVEVYEDVHRTLHEVLSEAEDADGPDQDGDAGPGGPQR
jgi:hypothetical protein